MQYQGFDPSKVPTSYGDTLTFWDWKERKIVQQIKLGNDGLIPLEVIIWTIQHFCERLSQFLEKSLTVEDQQF